ncbi:MAG: endonuclease/exonuclease/phosphatase family protein [Candidatus Electrothrix sp. GW3-4]|uniref:endonuclease/exonuclease/phosphatase family protein n=1 Tax=Candidatus Electrothrix sp. GW3-4 TaxID=3126740 RepID=UPI0030D4B249
MRFLLYNIRYGAGIGSQFHFPVPYAGYLKRSIENYRQITEFITRLAPDIVALVEVDSGSFRTGNCCQAESLARSLGYHHIVESKYRSGSLPRRVPVLAQQGNALLSKEKIIDHQFHFFRTGIKQLVIEATTANLTVFLVHLSLTYYNRQSQLQQLYEIVTTTQGPVIVAGDFNVFWGDQELALFLAATHLRSANDQGSPSHPSRSPKRQLDFILYSPELTVKDFFIPDVILSDHTPLVCDFSE